MFDENATLLERLPDNEYKWNWNGKIVKSTDRGIIELNKEIEV